MGAECFPEVDGARVGVELEWLLVSSDGSEVDPARVREALGSCDTLDSGTKLTFEPGGQLELSSLPLPDVGAACNVLSRDTGSVRDALSPAGIGILGIGLNPVHTPRVLVDTPRYRAMHDYFTAGGAAGGMMMCDTAAVHVNLDVGSSSTRDGRWQLVHAIGPTLSAAFAHSPFAGGLPSGSCSTRLSNWWEIDPSRTAPVFKGRGPVEDWLEYALDARVMFIRASEENFVPLREDLPFRDWMVCGHELGCPTADDFRYHLTTLFPPIRPQGRLELRFVDALPDPWWRVPVAVIACLLDDPVAADEARRATVGVSDMWGEASREGLEHPALAEAARVCFAAVREALPRITVDAETAELVAAYDERYVRNNRCPADDLLDDWTSAGHLLPVGASRVPSWT